VDFYKKIVPYFADAYNIMKLFFLHNDYFKIWTRYIKIGRTSNYQKAFCDYETQGVREIKLKKYIIQNKQNSIQ